MRYAHASYLSSVRWCPASDWIALHSPLPREGHVMCVFGPFQATKWYLLVDLPKINRFTSYHRVHMSRTSDLSKRFINGESLKFWFTEPL